MVVKVKIEVEKLRVHWGSKSKSRNREITSKLMDKSKRQGDKIYTNAGDEIQHT